MQNLFVITHAQSVHHIEGVGGGWYDTSLTEKGIIQANELGKNLFEEIGIPGIPLYASDLKRAAETASFIAAAFGSPITSDPRLREFNFGEAGGKPKEWMDAHVTPLPAAGNRLDHRMFEGSETRRDIGLRISECINDIIATGNENSIVVTHGHALTYIIMAWLKVPVEHMDFCQFRAAPATVTLLNEDDVSHSRNVVYICKTFES